MKIYLDTIGCRLNQAEIEQYARQFHAAGHALVSSPDQADLAVVNTCAVTSAASSDSRGKIRKMARRGVEQVIVTGCWATLKPQDAAKLPAVKRVVSNLEKDHLVADLLQIPVEAFDVEPVERQPVPGARLRTRAFIKVQDGCDNRCTFCITTVARGAGRSRPLTDILADIRAATCSNTSASQNPTSKRCAKEIVLTGVHLGSWGVDISPEWRLKELVQAILAETGVPRLRLSSLEPWDIDPDFFDLWQNPRLCPHLHLPLQSGSATTLRRMARKVTPQSYADLVAAARAAIPDIAITTDIITGFPGESETEFADSLSLVRAMDFTGGHVFTYSARQETAAGRMPDQIPFAIRKERNALMRAAFTESSNAYRERFIGQVLPVLWESVSDPGPSGWELSGLTDNYLRVNAQASRPLWNQITPVKLTGANSTALTGQIQKT